MVEYTVTIKKNRTGETKELTVIAESISHALDLVDLYLDEDEKDWEIHDCIFIKRIKTCLIERPKDIGYL